MAGNIVKWWRQLKQYKQFSVLQECTTDSEELIYKTQLSSTSPPDLLLTNNNNHTHQKQQSSLDNRASSSENFNATFPTSQQQQHKHQNKPIKVKDNSLEIADLKAKEKLQKRHSIATTRHLEANHKLKSNDFSCEIEARKTQTPVQFSFTLYDLDGHGKITKDDIAGIVSTIYDSIGKNVVVPHYGKKTINVKLTVSADSKNHGEQTINFNGKFQRQYRVHALLSDEENDSETISESFEFRPNVVIDNEKVNTYEQINFVKDPADRLNRDNNKSYNNESGNSRVKSSNHKPSVPLTTRKKNPNRKDKRKQRNSNVPLRARSYSMGNDHHMRKGKAHEADDYEITNNSNNLRRHELIEIIRESMEKNRLCFQNNRKTDSNLNEIHHSRPRASTITCTNKNLSKTKSGHNCIDKEQHLCAFDSVLHSTICSNLKSFSQLESANHSALKSSSRKKQQQHTTPDATTVLKLKTSVLNQLDPNLTPEEKFTRKINDVEKWLCERDNVHRMKYKEDRNAQHCCNSQEKLSSPTAFSTPKKENQISTPKKVSHQTPLLKQHKEAINNTKMKSPFEYSHIPISGNVSEFESLIDLSENEEEEVADEVNLETASKSSSLRFVHIHHHFYHFDSDGKFD